MDPDILFHYVQFKGFDFSNKKTTPAARQNTQRIKFGNDRKNSKLKDHARDLIPNLNGYYIHSKDSQSLSCLRHFYGYFEHMNYF